MTNDLNSGTPNPTLTKNDNRDLTYASITMVFAISVACVLFYGAWWRRAKLPEKYRVEHDAAVTLYERQVETEIEDRDPDGFFELGSRVDVLSKRLYRFTTDPSRQWQRSEFLRAHAHRLDQLVQSPDRWSDPGLLEDALQRIRGYSAQSDELAEKVMRSESPFQSEANVRRIEDAIAHAMPSRELAQAYREDLRAIWQSDAERKTENTLSQSPTEAALVADPIAAKRRALLMMTVLTMESAWDSASASMPLIANETDAAAAVQDLAELRSAVASETGIEAHFLDIALILCRAQIEPEKTGESSSDVTLGDEVDAIYTDSIIRQSKLKTSTHVIDWLPGLAACCLQADWSRVNELLSKLSRQDTLSNSEISMVRRWTARLICRLIVSLDRSLLNEVDGATVSNGLSLAIALDAGGAETCSMLHTIALLRSDIREPSVEEGITSRFHAAMDAALAMPSQPASFVSGVIATGFDDDSQRQTEVAEAAEMLQSELPMRVAFVALWQYGVTEGDSSPEIGSADEASQWCRTLELLLTYPEADSSGKAYCQIALSAWQFRNGRFDDSYANLLQARDLLGPVPVVGQLERAHAARQMSKP
ncbi:hypothetical protein Poly51_53790 [Rubripirellula tenax]|uniref:Uncharacterized protein n=1 Tax=Rubripirellula tenax TaxID=2528015 RepID=A0A5C6EJX6_9BACT|nr:hypothetical protein [Rubripirellula tenax]TWU47579.1 hypothetical protein Poly51_53790 [Rubripirellula tenax]